MYDLQDLLIKMGAPEVREKGSITWHYFDQAKKQLAGVAEIRLEAGGDRLIAELKHIRENVEDDNGKIHPTYIDNFYMAAERTARPGQYRIVRLDFDGAAYDRPGPAVVGLGLGIFHARALDISVKMVEQTFNKQDIVETTITTTSASIKPKPQQLRKFLSQKEPATAANRAIQPRLIDTPPEPCVIIPFRPRAEVQPRS